LATGWRTAALRVLDNATPVEGGKKIDPAAAEAGAREELHQPAPGYPEVGVTGSRMAHNSKPTAPEENWRARASSSTARTYKIFDTHGLRSLGPE
jgi:hypothetical protein